MAGKETVEIRSINGIRLATFSDELRNKLDSWGRARFSTWLRELCENHKSTWEADSRGGEPNHREEP
ncbi:MAG: hypothetical protein IK038_03410 [Bacteroidaceae bacterium]|nr:hypothetical protein [Bacteroidaceae bacterium]